MNAKENNSKYLLPPLKPSEEEMKRKTLVLDMDGTITYTTRHLQPNTDFTIDIEFGSAKHTLYITKRPGLSELLQQLSGLFEIVLFTASHKFFADAVLEKLLIDHDAIPATHRLYNDSCLEFPEVSIKDLSRLGRDLGRVIFADDMPHRCYQPRNAFPVPAFNGDKNDKTFFRLIDFCRSVAGSTSDVREAIDSYAASCIDKNGLLPAQTETNKFTLVLEFDRALVFTNSKPVNHDFSVDFQYCGENCRYFVLKRPGLDLFLDQLRGLFEIVVFTKTEKTFADAVLDRIDPTQTVFPLTHRIYRDSCVVVGDEETLKDLSKLGRDLRKVLCVDVWPGGILQMENMWPVECFVGDMKDKTLFNLLGELKYVAQARPFDLRTYLVCSSIDPYFNGKGSYNGASGLPPMKESNDM